MNVPLSVGPEYEELDNAGVSCLVFDIIVNTKVLQEANDDETGQYRDFLCHLSIQSVEQKYPKCGNLDRQYKLPKLKYMGAPIKSQHIRDKKSVPKIQDISVSPATIPKVAKNKNGVPKENNNDSEYKEPDKDLPYRLVWLKENANAVPHKDACKKVENMLVKNLHNQNDDNEIDVDTNVIKGSADNKSNRKTSHTNSPLQFFYSSQTESPIIFPNSNTNEKEYSEPIFIPSDEIVGIALLFNVPGSIDLRQIDVQVTPYKFQVMLHCGDFSSSSHFHMKPRSPQNLFYFKASPSIEENEYKYFFYNIY